MTSSILPTSAKTLLQIGSQSQIPGIRISTQSFSGGQNSTHNIRGEKEQGILKQSHGMKRGKKKRKERIRAFVLFRVLGWVGRLWDVVGRRVILCRNAALGQSLFPF